MKDLIYRNTIMKVISKNVLTYNELKEEIINCNYYLTYALMKKDAKNIAKYRSHLNTLIDELLKLTQI